MAERSGLIGQARIQGWRRATRWRPWRWGRGSVGRAQALRQLIGRPASAQGTVELHPGQAAFALQGHQAGLGGHRIAAGVFELEQAGQAALVARLGGAQGLLKALGRGRHIGRAVGGRLQAHQRLFDLAHRGAQAAAVAGGRLVVAGPGGLDIGAAGCRRRTAAG